jgi:hypothetical protein
MCFFFCFPLLSFLIFFLLLFSSFDDLTKSVMTQFVACLLSTYQSFRRKACL